VAVTPDGRHLYVTNTAASSVSAFSIAADGSLTAIGSAVSAGNSPAALAVTPDGSHLYVTNQNTANISAYSIDADGSLTPLGNTAAGGSIPLGVSVTPDGSHLYVADQGSGQISAFAIGAAGVLTPVAGSPFSVGSDPSLTAITPDGAHLYVSTVDNAPPTPPPPHVWAFSIVADGTLSAVNGSPFSAGSQPQGVAVTPDGAHLYVVNEVTSGSVTAFSIATDGSLSGVNGSPFAAGASPLEVAISPDQGPVAAFSASPAPEGAASTLDGSGSADSDGTVARYDWNFGDGVSASNGGPTPKHTYAKPGSYAVSLTVTDNEGCSTKQVYTGQTVLCNGGPAATITHTVSVPKATPTVTIATPPNGATYGQGQSVTSSFSCSDGTGPGIASCLNQAGGSSGSPVDTRTAGQHTFTVTATSSDGVTATASTTYTVKAKPAPPKPRCRLATGRLAGQHVGPLSLGLTRTRARHKIKQNSNRGMSYQDFFCLRPIGIRVGYASPKLLNTLPRSQRGKYRGRVVWISTANHRYAVRGVRPGATLRSAQRRLSLGRRIVIGHNDWYLGRLGSTTAVLKVRRGKVQEVGIAVRALTLTRRAQAIFMGSFG
jgi:6-phosphogluconolactonase (cycloisomerase 2 family)